VSGHPAGRKNNKHIYPLTYIYRAHSQHCAASHYSPYTQFINTILSATCTFIQAHWCCFGIWIQM